MQGAGDLLEERGPERKQPVEHDPGGDPHQVVASVVFQGARKALEAAWFGSWHPVQQSECQEIAAAWGGVRGILLHEPRLAKTGLQIEKLEAADPDLFEL